MTSQATGERTPHNLGELLQPLEPVGISRLFISFNDQKRLHDIYASGRGWEKELISTEHSVTSLHAAVLSELFSTDFPDTMGLPGLTRRTACWAFCSVWLHTTHVPRDWISPGSSFLTQRVSNLHSQTGDLCFLLFPAFSLTKQEKTSQSVFCWRRL